MQPASQPAPSLPNLTTPAEPLALYLHIPFCHVRCTYCAFNIYTKREALIAPYMRALRREIALVGADRRLPARSVYFGGGTPSLVPAPQIGATIAACAEAFALASDAEITVEVNPGSVDAAYLNALRTAGANRLSIGMQSAHAEELRLYARLHTQEDVAQTVRWTRAAGIDNLSLDLIYGGPRQTLAMWQASLRAALVLEPDHLSFYSLTIEDSTTFARWRQSGRIPEPDADLAADMYEWAGEQLAAAGFEQYEISNWARPGKRSQHNLTYWRSQPYLGLGAGAAGCVAGVRYDTVLRPEAYIARIEAQHAPQPFPLSAAAEHVEHQDDTARMAEWMFMGLRLVQDGISPHAFAARFGRALDSVYGAEIDRLLGWKLLEATPDGHLRLTPRGRLLGNRVFAEFV